MDNQNNLTNQINANSGSPQLPLTSPPTDNPQVSTPSPSEEPTATPVTMGIYTDGTAPTQSATLTSTPIKKPNNKIVPIAIVTVLAVVVLIVGLYFLFKNSGSKKTTVDFEKIIANIGYTKATNDLLNYSGPEGKYTTYSKGSGNSVDGIAMFYDAESKDELKNAVGQAGDGVEEALSSFDWSKERNTWSQCNDKKPYVCMDVTQIDNTMLITYYHSDSLDEAKSEVAKVVNAMGY